MFHQGGPEQCQQRLPQPRLGRPEPDAEALCLTWYTKMDRQTYVALGLICHEPQIIPHRRAATMAAATSPLISGRDGNLILECSQPPWHPSQGRPWWVPAMPTGLPAQNRPAFTTPPIPATSPRKNTGTDAWATPAWSFPATLGACGHPGRLPLVLHGLEIPRFRLPAATRVGIPRPKALTCNGRCFAPSSSLLIR